MLDQSAGAPRGGRPAGGQGDQGATVDVARDRGAAQALERRGQIDVLADLGTVDATGTSGPAITSGTTTSWSNAVYPWACRAVAKVCVSLPRLWKTAKPSIVNLSAA